MADREELDPRGRGVDVGPLVLRTPGLRGRASLVPASDAGGRGAQLGTEELAAALAAADVSERYTVEIDDVREDDRGGGGRGHDAAGALEVDVPAPAADEGQVLMLVEEDGAITWHLPEAATSSDTRGREMVRYRLPSRTVDAPRTDDDGASRGLLSIVGSKVLKILSYAIDPLLAAAGTAFSRKWETAHRPARFRTFTPENYRTGTDAADLGDADWARLSAGPALLFVHGTFSSAHTAFPQLPRDAFAALAQRYGDRVFALDHHSVWLPPSENAVLAAQALPDLPLEVDIIAHSRGGLVARELAERAALAGIPDSFRVRRVVMLGTPNAGTALAETANIRKWLDLVTNLAQFVPDNPVTDAIALVLTVLKQVALGVFDGLPGITSMDPAGDYLRALNAVQPTATYFTVAADFEPPEGSPLKRVAHDLAIDTLFGGAQNDLVVPTAGVTQIPGLAGFHPTALDFAADDAVDHMTFFGNPRVIEKLTQWLPG